MRIRHGHRQGIWYNPPFRRDGSNPRPTAIVGGKCKAPAPHLGERRQTKQIVAAAGQTKSEFYVMWSRLREVFARELVVLVDPTNAHHARRRKQLTAAVGTVFALGMAAAMGVAPRSAYDDPQAPRVLQPMRLPDLREQLDKLTDSDATYVRRAHAAWRHHRHAAQAAGRGRSRCPAFIAESDRARPVRPEPGQAVQAEVDERNLLVSLQANLGGDVANSRLLVIERAGGDDQPAIPRTRADGGQRDALRDGVGRDRQRRLLQRDGRRQRTRRDRRADDLDLRA